MALHANLESSSGLTDPVLSSQSVFRRVMNALARPGSIQAIADTVHASSPLMQATAAVALTLFDHDTPVWLDNHFAGIPAISEWLRFHSDAPLTTDASRAAFALIHNGTNLPDFADFALGTPEYPDQSTTLLIQVETLTKGPELVLCGPGIKGMASLRAGALPPDFAERMQTNSALFPRGIDLLLTCGTELVALPRSTRVTVKGT
ncbi:alpha-D-ribose 1-methylphosphonate 5-triphosphate synthase subunit PhnH [Afipia massiliensis]|uniref:Alpha-D-ribose 1-methylphosphonate 5-triphosphate synthase subunit PhnH n=1 Tax=Afipia massiliensis TaxID=211460 RepID=A0A840MUQ9_9BRAD|nr:phosphonate C-P lyase system protein PhnH [Afipia massiliensis]MBB5050372.1 alpha-D-ribose 1-methylphosphonate 5-triphosphate synthase subunit PhnH [Afipia massiliensis]